MATGTPVITTRSGSVPEIIEDGVTGVLCDSVQEMALACERAAGLDRAACRASVERRFSVEAMADGYEAVYRRLVQEHRDTGAGNREGDAIPATQVSAARPGTDGHTPAAPTDLLQTAPTRGG
jgi:hypothetical protein